MKNVIDSNTAIKKDITSIFDLLYIVNEFKKTPKILSESFFDKSYFLNIISRESIFDCYVMELILLKSNLNAFFSSKVTIENLTGFQRTYKNNLIRHASNAVSNLKIMFHTKLLRSGIDKIFDSSTSVKALIEQGTRYGDNYISINGQLHKSFLLNQIVRHGREFF